MVRRNQRIRFGLLLVAVGMIAGCVVPLNILFTFDIPTTVLEASQFAGEGMSTVCTSPEKFAIPTEAELLEGGGDQIVGAATLQDIGVDAVNLTASSAEEGVELDLSFVESIQVVLLAAGETDAANGDVIGTGGAEGNSIQLTADTTFDILAFIRENEDLEGDPSVVICVSGTRPSGDIVIEGTIEATVEVEVNPLG